MMGGHMRHMLGREQLRAKSTRAVLRRMMGYLKPFWPQLLVVVILIVVGTLAQLAGPYLIGLAVDKFIVGGDETGLARTMLLLLGAYALSWATETPCLEAILLRLSKRVSWPTMKAVTPFTSMLATIC